MTVRRLRHLVVIVLATWAILLVAGIGLAAFDLAAARRAATAVEAADAGDVGSGALRSRLAEVERRAGRAHRVLTSPVAAPARLLPVAGRQLRSVAALAGAADTTADAAGDVVATTDRLRTSRPATGPERIAAAGEVHAALGAAERRLRAIDLGPRIGLLRSLARTRNDVAARVAAAEQRAADGAALTGTLRDLLVGPGRYLLLVCNNAEMRSGSGMPLSVGTLDAAGGDLVLGEVVPTADLRLDEPITVTGDLAERWGFTDPGREWRSLAMSPRFDATAELAARLWQARTGEAVAGVLAVDVAALRVIVEATAPVQVGDELLSGEELEDHLLHGQYVAFGSRRDRDQSARREALGGVASEAVARLRRGEGDLETLLDGLAGAAAGRHVLAWSRDPGAQAGWLAAGVAGVLDDADLLAALVNRGENKLDHFTRLRHSLRAARAVDGTTAVEIESTVENRTPGGEPDYVAGPVPGLTERAGTYLGLLSLHVPGGATGIEVELDGEPCPLSAAGADGPTRVAACPVRVEAGSTVVVTARFSLPASLREVRIVPGARLPAARWRVGSRTASESRPMRIALPDGTIVT